MKVIVSPEADSEMQELPPNEEEAMLHAVEKLEALDIHLSYPHSSQVKGTQLRELRPRAGRSPWRAWYQRIGNQLIVVAIAPEAQNDSRGFKHAVKQAQLRLRRFQD